nr:unnamed protein product [Spirometra erinaceieuropaei]
MFSRLTGSPDLPNKTDLISAQSAAKIEQANANYEEEYRRWQLEQQKKAQEAALRAKIERYLASESGKKMLRRKQDEMQSVMRWTIRILREFRRMRAALDELDEDFDPELLRKLRAVQMLEMLLTQQADSGNSRGIDVQAEIARDTAAMAESENEEQGFEVEPKTSLSVNAEQTQ